MKYLIAIFVFAPLVALSQQATHTFQELVHSTRVGILHEKTVDYNAEIGRLIIGNLAIPVSIDTHLKYKKTQGNHFVEFALQNGTAITDINDSNFKKAWLQLAFMSKKSAKKFVQIFKQAAKANLKLADY